MQAPGQVQRGSEVSGEGLGGVRCRARSGSGFRRRFRRRFQEALHGAKPSQVQQGSGESSQRRFRRRSGRLPGQVQQGSVEGSGKLGAEPGQVQQGSLRRSQRRSGRLWCRAGESLGGFGPKVQNQVEKVPEKVWQALVQSQVRLNPEKVPEKVPLVQSQVRFNRVSEKVPRRFRESPGSFSAEPGLVQQGSGEGSGEALGGFGAKPGEVQQGSEEGSGEGRGGFGAEPGQVQQSSGESSGEGCREGFGEGSGEGCREGSGEVHFSPFFCFRACARFRMICKNKRCGCWRYHRSLFLVVFICQESFLKTSVCSSLCSSTPFLAPSLRLCACAAPL